MSVDSFESAFCALVSAKATMSPISTAETKTGVLLAEPRVAPKKKNMTWYKLRVDGKMIELSIFDDESDISQQDVLGKVEIQGYTFKDEKYHNAKKIVPIEDWPVVVQDLTGEAVKEAFMLKIAPPHVKCKSEPGLMTTIRYSPVSAGTLKVALKHKQFDTFEQINSSPQFDWNVTLDTEQLGLGSDFYSMLKTHQVPFYAACTIDADEQLKVLGIQWDLLNYLKENAKLVDPKDIVLKKKKRKKITLDEQQQIINVTLLARIPPDEKDYAFYELKHDKKKSVVFAVLQE